MKIVHGFMFYNELDLLNYALNVLDPVIDYFIIVESIHTHMGHIKQLYYQENKHLFKQFHDKIIHIIVTDFPYPNPNVANREQWHNENFQRNAIHRGLQQLSLNDNDLIIIADLDEIPDPRTIISIKTMPPISFNAFNMDMYYYNLCVKIHHNWTLTKILSYKKYIEFRDSGISITDIRLMTGIPEIKMGGWHLSYFGDHNFIKNKIMEFTHQEYNNDHYISKIEENIKNGADLYMRDVTFKYIKICDNTYLPVMYETYLQKFIPE